MNVTQIQIAPVENGFVIQCVALDGQSGGRKLVANSVEDCRTKLHALVDEFHVEKPKIVKPTAAETAKAGSTKVDLSKPN